MKKNLILILFSFTTLSCFFTQVNSSLNKKNFLIGEEILIKYDLIYNIKEGQLQYIPWKNTIPLSKISWKVNDSLPKKEFRLEIVKGYKDTLIKINRNKYHWIGKYKTTIWDSGNFVIPKHFVSLQNKVYEFPELSFSVKFPDLSKNSDFYDIKEKFGIVESKNTFFWLFIILGILVIFGIIIFIFYKIKGKSKILNNENLAFEKVLFNELKELFDKRLWVNKETQHIHYLYFSNILKSFLSKKHSLSLIDRTSSEIIKLLKQKKIENFELEELNTLMSQMDFIKFAQTTVDENIVMKHKSQFLKMLDK